jgi:hypothetical protein
VLYLARLTKKVVVYHTWMDPTYIAKRPYITNLKSHPGFLPMSAGQLLQIFLDQSVEQKLGI